MFGIIGTLMLPVYSEAKTLTAQSGTIDATSLTTSSSRPTITGTAEGVKKVKLVVYREGGERTLHRTKTIRVSHDGTWKSRITRNLSEGTYVVKLVSGTGSKAITLVESELTVTEGDAINSPSAKSKASFLVSSVPLLSGGYVRNGAVIPVSYLQITNTGSESGTMRGFWMTQKGTGKTSLMQALLTVDDSGTVRKEKRNTSKDPLFSGSAGYAPTDLKFSPGEMRLFTIKTEIAASGGAQGDTFTLYVSLIDATGSAHGAFPIAGTTWTLTK